MPANNEATGKVALIGAGRMGLALAAGWLRARRGGLDSDTLVIVEPNPSDELAELAGKHGIKVLPTLTKSAAAGLDRVVLAVKPQALPALGEELGGKLPRNALIISILAGAGLIGLGRLFPGHPIIRAMPNTPGSIGKGITVAISNIEADPPHFRAAADALLKVLGSVEWVEDERMMDAVTAVSGSGPAYVFLMCEALARAGEAEGLPAELAEKLAVATIAGAGALLEDGHKRKTADAAALRRAVTSPGGTTQAALDVMMAGGGLPMLVRNAVAAAERQSRKLGSAL
ncbi:pyrroline-5-carboxylate reductase [Synechococcus moorigangaii CMS01]|jgi:pyrroline-5-carboxylate reductase|nr:pyrroline-5-carboxylate reductase [Synechococcus moorigangaii CMS01]